MLGCNGSQRVSGSVARSIGGRLATSAGRRPFRRPRGRGLCLNRVMDAAHESEIAFVMELATALHRYGTPAHRLESAMAAVALV